MGPYFPSGPGKPNAFFRKKPPYLFKSWTEPKPEPEEPTEPPPRSVLLTGRPRPPIDEVAGSTPKKH